MVLVRLLIAAFIAILAVFAVTVAAEQQKVAALRVASPTSGTSDLHAEDASKVAGTSEIANNEVESSKKKGSKGEPDEPARPPTHPLPKPPPVPHPKEPRPPRPQPPPPGDPSHPFPLPSWPFPGYEKTNLSVEHPGHFATRDLTVLIDERWNFGAFELLERLIHVNTTSQDADEEVEKKKKKMQHPRDLVAGVLTFPHPGGNRGVGKADHPAALLAFFKDHEAYHRPAHHFKGHVGEYDGGAMILYDSVIEFIDTDGNGHFEPGSKDEILQVIDIPQLKFDDIEARRGNHSTIVELDSMSVPEEDEPEISIRALVGDEVGIEDSEHMVLGPRSVHLDIKIIDFPFTKDKDSRLALRLLVGAASPKANLSFHLSGNKLLSTTAENPQPYDPYVLLVSTAQLIEPDINGTKGTECAAVPSNLAPINVTALPPSPARGFIHSTQGIPAIYEVYITFASKARPSYIKWGTTLGLGRQMVLTEPGRNGGSKHRWGRWWIYVLAVLLLPLLGMALAWVVDPAVRRGYVAVGGFD